MKILSYLVFGLSVCFLVLGILYLKNSEKNRRNNLFFLAVLGSFLWGIGYSLLIVQTSLTPAVIFRGIGLVGSVMFSICGVNVIADLAGISPKTKKVILFFSLIGLILCPFLVMPERLVYKISETGTNYEPVSDIWNMLYNVYTVIIFVILIAILVSTRKKCKLKRDRAMNNGLWLFLVVYLSGLVVDIIISSFGFGACPGSTISQFIAVFIIYKRLIYQNKNSLSLENVFNHLHHSIEMPIIVFDDNKCLDFASDAFYTFFNKDKSNSKGLKLTDLFMLESDDIFNQLLDGNLVEECFARDSKRYCSLAIEKVLDSYGDIVGYIILVNDQTDKYKIISELKAAKEALVQVTKIQDN